MDMASDVKTRILAIIISRGKVQSDMSGRRAVPGLLRLHLRRLPSEYTLSLADRPTAISRSEWGYAKLYACKGP